MEPGDKCTIEHASGHARNAVLILREGILTSYLMFSPDQQDRLPKTLRPEEAFSMTSQRQIEICQVMGYVGRMLLPETEVELFKIIS
ncbi:MAG TPA: hypothetical protein DCX32_02745 [Candidatus Moranbacteria bacterium]|nr:MAG: hypothetical protein UW87_C0048G0005 [Candidatus Moranbacteria bacterium GW2011_GWC2_45_10]KKT95123.1 MAG: hypothetical protein UW95_C0004G0041 [Parcubacteria group bacterium GW2011_GWC1_45_14]HAV11439.1 hypothetical protein [Candidatus Moranbacteria bacterium]